MKLFPIYVIFPFIFVKVFVYMLNLTEGIWRYEVLASTQKQIKIWNYFLTYIIIFLLADLLDI